MQRFYLFYLRVSERENDRKRQGGDSKRRFCHNSVSTTSGEYRDHGLSTNTFLPKKWCMRMRQYRICSCLYKWCEMCSRMIEFNSTWKSTVWTMTTDKRQYLQPHIHSQTHTQCEHSVDYVNVCVRDMRAIEIGRTESRGNVYIRAARENRCLGEIGIFLLVDSGGSPIPKMDPIRFDRTFLTAHFRNFPFDFIRICAASQSRVLLKCSVHASGDGRFDISIQVGIVAHIILVAAMSSVTYVSYAPTVSLAEQQN